jgi:hypothetical protein
VSTTIPDRKENRTMHAEVRGRGSSWKVWTPDPGGFATSVHVFDQEGAYVETLMVGAPNDHKYVESFGGPFATTEEAIEYARYLGYEEVKIVKTKTKEEALAKARAARQKGET